MKEMSAQFEATLASCEAIAAFVRQCTQDARLSDEQRHNLQIAVDEHFANLIEHAFQDQPESLITLTYQENSQQVQMKISDASAGFDPRNFVVPDVEGTPVNDLKPGGFGNYFISELMDNVEYIHQPYTENTLILTVYTSHPSANNKGE
jgi:anti-sigma regulatory factor (Ser/Thr protein kinase)